MTRTFTIIASICLAPILRFALIKQEANLKL